MKINCPWCGNPCDIDGNMVGGDAQCLHCGKDFLAHEDDVYDREVPQAAAVPAPRDGGQPAASPTGPSSYVEETRTTFRPLACEMCGGTDLVKRDGVFVCQSCGTKYSLEEARKLMVSGTVNVAGTVKREPDYRPPRRTTWWTVPWKAAWILLGVAAGVGVLFFLFKFGCDLLTGLRERLHW